ncbi:MAG: NUDIX domain-containing protein [Anaerolineales bacterium]
MILLKEIVHKPGLCMQGKTVWRDSVRGIIPHRHDLLMVYSAQTGGYKFPGGGICNGETHEEALRREIQEESGAALSEIKRAFGKVIEYDAPIEPDYDVFRKTSYYYVCRVDDVLGKCRLDAYEEDLGFTPVWIDMDAAIQANSLLLQGDRQEIPQWTMRELFVLQQVKAQNAGA